MDRHKALYVWGCSAFGWAKNQAGLTTVKIGGYQKKFSNRHVRQNLKQAILFWHARQNLKQAILFYVIVIYKDALGTHY